MAGRRIFVFAASILCWVPSTQGPPFRRAMTTNVRTGLADLRKELESPKPDLERCKKLLVQLKVGCLLVESWRSGVALRDSWAWARASQGAGVKSRTCLINC